MENPAGHCMREQFDKPACLPYDEGTEAYNNRKLPEDNPYPKEELKANKSGYSD